MGSAVLLMITLLFVLLLIGAPVGVCLILPIVPLIYMTKVTSITFIANILYSGVASYTLICLPFFILSGNVMNLGGLSKRLVRIANSFVGKITGSLGMVAILACMFFGAVSGSAPATVAAIGSIMLPEMVRGGYNKYYSIALITVAGGLGVIVPPSFPMVVYGVTMSVSIGDLFIGGLGPAVVVGIILCTINYVYCRKHKLKGTRKFSWMEVGLSIKDGWPALLMPVIILGGIYGGIFTATEAAVVACVYSILIGTLYYREIKLPRVFEEFRVTGIFIGGTMLTLAPAAALGKIFSLVGINKSISMFFGNVSNNYFVIMLCVFLILFVAGMFIQTTPMIVILGPLLYNVLAPFGVTGLQFGIIMILALAIAFCTPPMASNLFVATSMTGVPLDKIIRPMIPFVLGLTLALFLVAFIPQIITLPMKLFGA
ncbi:MAG: TRAP transporter large permease [Oscillospiraceae bacterium]